MINSNFCHRITWHIQEWRKDNNHKKVIQKSNCRAELVSASIYKEIPKSSWIIVSLTSHKTILNCFIRQSAVAHFICSANIIRYAPCYFEFRTASSLYTKFANSEWRKDNNHKKVIKKTNCRAELVSASIYKEIPK